MDTNKIRVLHILDELNTGGAERIVFSYYQHINRENFQWDFVMTRYADPKKKGILEDKIESMGGHIYRVHRKRENYLKNIKDIDEIIKKGKYDIVHSHLDELSAFYLMSAKHYNVPVRICHSHLVGTDRGCGVELLCKFLRPIMKYVTTDKFACGNDAGSALWGTDAVKNGNVHIMKNAIDIKTFIFDEQVRKAKRKELHISEDNVVIGSVGRLSYQKNSDFIVDIFNEYHKKNQNSTLLLVGVGDLLDVIKKKIEDYNLQNNVQFLGSRDDVNKIMMAMDAFLLPSRFEGLPIVMVEAQCSGLTCFVSDTVTKEIKLSDSVKYLSLDEGAKKWASFIKKNLKLDDRYLGAKYVEDNGYEIASAAMDLEEYYVAILEKKHEMDL